MPKEAMAVKMAKSTAIVFQPKPFSRAYIGPPSIFPLGVFWRYLMASRPSAYFVEMPKTPVSQHHSTAPGPPRAMAVATPMMLPVPMVAARAVANEPNCDTSPVASGSRFTERRMAFKMWRWGKRRRMVRKICVPNSRMIIGHPHSRLLNSVRKSFTWSMCIYLIYYCLNVMTTVL